MNNKHNTIHSCLVAEWEHRVNGFKVLIHLTRPLRVKEQVKKLTTEIPLCFATFLIVYVENKLARCTKNLCENYCIHSSTQNATPTMYKTNFSLLQFFSVRKTILNCWYSIQV